MKPVPHGEPYAGKLHVRFDEGAGVPDNKGRPALLYTLGVHIPLPSAERSDFATSAEEESSASTARHIQLVHLEGLEPPRFRSGT